MGASNVSTQEAEAGGWQIAGHPGLQQEERKLNQNPRLPGVAEDQTEMGSDCSALRVSLCVHFVQRRPRAASIEDGFRVMFGTILLHLKKKNPPAMQTFPLKKKYGLIV